MPSIIIPSRTRRQPQGPVAVASGSDRPAVAFCCSAGLVELSEQRLVDRASTSLAPYSSGIAVDFPVGAASRAVGPYTQLRGPSALTGIAVWRPAVGRQWFTADASRWFVSTRNASNQGWSWGRVEAVDGVGLGNLTKQGFVLQGVAQYTSTSNTIPSFPPAAVGFVWSGSTVQFYDDGGVKTPRARDSIATGALSTGGDLFVGGQGPAGTNEWLGAFEMLALWPKALPQAQMLDLLANPYQLFRPALSNRIFSFPQALYTAIDEPSPPDRADYVEATAANSEYTFTVSSIAQPPAGTNIEVNYDATTTEGSLQVEFFQSAGWGVFLSQRWRRQPQGPVAVDWGNPSSKRLLALYNGSVGRFVFSRGVERYTNPTNGAYSGIYGTGPRLGTSEGAAYSEVGSLSAQTPLTIAAITQWGALSGFQYHAGIVKHDQLGARLPTLIAASNYSAQYTDGTLKEISVSGIAPTVGVGAIQVLTYDPGAQTLTFAVRTSTGQSGLTTVTSVATFLYPAESPLSFGLGLASNFSTSAHSTPVALYAQAAWTDAQVRSFLENPWQLFRPRIPRTYMLPDELRIATKTIPMGVNGTGTLRITPGEYAAVPSWPWTPRVRLTSK